MLLDLEVQVGLLTMLKPIVFHYPVTKYQVRVAVYPFFRKH